MRRVLTVVFLLLLAALVFAPGAALLAWSLGTGPQSLTEDPLYGQVLAADKPAVNVRTLWSGQAQLQLERWLAERMGAPRAKLIRISNLLDFRAGRSSNPGIMIGRDRETFTREMLNDWCLSGDSSFIDELVPRIARAYQRLRQEGKAFVVLISPNKAALKPDKVPGYCRPPASGRARARMAGELRQQGVPVMDSEALLLARRDTARLPTFGQYGQHWNDIGRFEPLRALVAEFERQLGRPVGTLELAAVNVDDQPHGADDDTGLLMNLPIGLHPLSPHATLAVRDRGDPLDLIIVGTSFSGGIVEDLLKVRLTSRILRFDYFRRIWAYTPATPHGVAVDTPPPELLAADLGRADGILLEVYAPALNSGHITAFLSAVEALP